MKKLTLTILATLTFGLSLNAHAATAITTQELLQNCKGANGTFITCEIYGQAVYDTYLVTRHPKTAPDYICVKQPAPTRNEIINDYVNWAETNTKYMSEPAADTILRFLAGKFPCSKTAK